jgi:hypothetical protein
MPRFRAVQAAWLLLLLSNLYWVAPAQAQDAPASTVDTGDRKARAADLDREARDAFAAGDFGHAAELFGEAHRTLPHPATRYNEAVARERAGQRAQAANLLEAVMAELPESDARRKDAGKRLAALRPRLGRLSLTTSEPASASIGFVVDRAAPFVVYLEPGKYPLEVSFRGGRRQRSVELRPGELLRLDVEAPAPNVPRLQALPAPVAERSNRTTWGLVTLGAGAAAGAASAALGYSTLQALDDFERSGYTDRDARERAVRLRLLTNVALGACAVTSGIGVYLLLSKPDERPASGSVSLFFGLDGAKVGGRF